LDWGGSYLEGKVAVALAAALSTLRRLQVVELDFNLIVYDAGFAEGLGQALQSWPALQRLSMTACFTDVSYMKPMVRALASGAAPQLQMLALKGISCLIRHAGDDLVQMLSSLHVWPALSNLTALELSSYSMTGDGARQLAAVLSSLPSLHTLKLQHNAIGVDGVRALAGMEEVFLAQLKHLDLSYNHYGQGGCCALADVVACMTSLRVLHVGGLHQHYNEGSSELLDALIGATQLTRLEEVHVWSTRPMQQGLLQRWQAAPHTARAGIHLFSTQL
jgi:Ran GTPase-activating protein (RanGAP) involved in mRNA processing and transport